MRGASYGSALRTDDRGDGYEPVNGAREIHPIDLAARVAVEGEAA